eukprot:TRINITY_DN14983_c0_g1_i1.p1 TRINITY_DN14983_c0_g1~~TRINITY_DN14983_c0_g1_i1.p1  ORF type:complete len:467 (-),score=35.33 TRINITY_DN14983_c0_g1_i1:242-1642(-)
MWPISPSPLTQPLSPLFSSPIMSPAYTGKTSPNSKDKHFNSRNSGQPQPLTTRILQIAVMLYLALLLSLILEFVTAYVVDFQSPSSLLLDDDDDRGDLIRHSDESDDAASSYPTLATYSPTPKDEWLQEDVIEAVPLVFYYARPGDLPCEKNHHVGRVVKQACSLNSLVYFIGPPECEGRFRKLGVIYQRYKEYEDVFEWFFRNIGQPVDNHIRWFILKRFMEKTGYPRAFYAATEVMLYTNVTELGAWVFPTSHIVLPARWPSIRPPLRANQYPSTAVSGHVALFSYEGLSDFCLFYLKVFEIALFGGAPGARELHLLPEYNDMTPMGWYTFAECWLKNLNPRCMAEKKTGISTKLAGEIRGKFRPRFRVESFCQPRKCQNSSWSDEGTCVFDNNFSITTAIAYFKFSSTDKCPSSVNYEYYEAWTREPQKTPVQFLGVHFQGLKKLFLTLEDSEPAHSWGGSDK